MSATDDLAARLAAAIGADHGLDAAIAAYFAVEPAEYTASVDDCRALVASVLPGWHLHLGYGVSGVFPYAELTRDHHHYTAEAPTVPLAILRAVVAAKESEDAE